MLFHRCGSGDGDGLASRGGGDGPGLTGIYSSCGGESAPPASGENARGKLLGSLFIYFIDVDNICQRDSVYLV